MHVLRCKFLKYMQYHMLKFASRFVALPRMFRGAIVYNMGINMYVTWFNVLIFVCPTFLRKIISVKVAVAPSSIPS
jgi:hypothetical protein